MRKIVLIANSPAPEQGKERDTTPGFQAVLNRGAKVPQW